MFMHIDREATDVSNQDERNSRYGEVGRVRATGMSAVSRRRVLTWTGAAGVATAGLSAIGRR
jgi:hypothetical protein